MPGQSSLSDDMYNNNKIKETPQETVRHSYSSGVNELTYLLNLQDMQIEN
ncbi:hypothetical protein KBA84_02590 [Patescibacteria group bacterium]|nr:hypothetical protein [Patescibacteria group bacterium]